MEDKKNTKKNKKNNTPKSGLNNLKVGDKFKIILASVVIFILLFVIMYRNSKINESFSEINGLKSEISKIQKENAQLEVKIQSSLNLSNVEQLAKELLGMQKLTNAQTIYIAIPKKDYIEINNDAKENFNDNNLWNKFINFFGK